MQLKISTDYAVRMVLYASIKQGVISSKEFSKSLGVSQNLVFKVGAKLQDAGLLYSNTGYGGGFSVSKQPEEISLYDIVNTMESTTKLNRCLEEDEYCSRFATDTCPVRKYYCSLQEAVENSLKSTTIKDLMGW